MPLYIQRNIFFKDKLQWRENLCGAEQETKVKSKCNLGNPQLDYTKHIKNINTQTVISNVYLYS